MPEQELDDAPYNIYISHINYFISKCNEYIDKHYGVFAHRCYIPVFFKGSMTRLDIFMNNLFCRCKIIVINPMDKNYEQ